MKTADLILCNADVITLDNSIPHARALAIRDGRITAIYRDQPPGEIRGRGSKVVDCSGKTVIPAFHDAHCHVVAFAESLLTLNLTPQKVCSISDIKLAIKEFTRKVPPGTWVRGWGYSEFDLLERRHPTRWDLDEVATNHPVKLTHRSGHATVLNSLALRLLNISIETPDPPGGMIERDIETGEPNGVLYDMERYLDKMVPPLSETEINRGIFEAGKIFLSKGITSIQDASPNNDMRRWKMFQNWKMSGTFKPRVTMMLGADFLGQYQDLVQCPQNVSSAELRLGPVKIMLTETTGEIVPCEAELNKKVLSAHDAGCQIAFHAVESNTIRAAITAVAHALRSSSRKKHRHRIEHCSVCYPQLANWIAELGLMVVTQPAFIYHSGMRYLATVPAEDLPYLYPLALLISSGIKVAAGSDCPVAPPEPIKAIYAAVTRKTSQHSVVSPEQKIPLGYALRMHTVLPAFACCEEKFKGTITAGKLADLVILSHNPAEVPDDELLDLEIHSTILGGEIVWPPGQ